MLGKRLVFLVLLVLSLGLMSISSVAAQSRLRSYIVIGNSESALPTFVQNQIRGLGGRVIRNLDAMGMAVVTSTDPNFASRLGGVRAVIPNIKLRLIDPERVVGYSGNVPNPPFTNDDDFFFDLQWGHDAVNAPEAWARGRRGNNVRVGVFDEGIDADHPDIAENLNAALSVSFVPGEDWDVQPGFYFNHGTHVGGTIGAADNGFGIIGVAPEVELVAVKVLSEFTGSGDFDWLISALKYAGDNQFDIVNMSLGAVLDRRGACDATGECYTTRDVLELEFALSRATNYAHRRGVTLIASAGNEFLNFDANRTLVSLPADSLHVISVSALGPVGWAVNPATNLDVFTPYSNYGKRVVDLSGPGGNYVYPGEEDCTVGGITEQCWVFDLVFSTISEGWGWAAGTSMAAPHVSGIAAQFIGAAGGRLNPTAVALALAAYSDDLGSRGWDAYYGIGRVSGVR